MVKWLRVARAIGGLLTIITLMSMIVLDFLSPELTVGKGRILLLLAIISAMMGVDMVSERLPVSVQVGEEREETEK